MCADKLLIFNPKMATVYLSKRNSENLILFFSGWASVPQMFSHLAAKTDVMLFYDYAKKNPSSLKISEINDYKNIYVIAWSFGVLMSHIILPEMHLSAKTTTFINGTPFMINDRYGIPDRIFRLTLKNMNSENRRKFFERMYGKENIIKFNRLEYKRTESNTREELKFLGDNNTQTIHTIRPDRVIISSEDLIVPTKNQKEYWKSQTIETEIINSTHYPFYNFKSWEEMLTS